MKTRKGSTLTSIILAVLLTALIVGGLSYYFLSYKLQEKTYEKEAEVTEEAENITEKEEKEEIAEENCYKIHEMILEGSGAFSFEYPCDWDVDVKGGTTWSETGTVVAPDKKASFNFPIPEFGLHETELISEEEILVGEQNNIATTYRTAQETIVLIRIKDDTMGISPGLMLAYKDSTHEEALAHILKTFGLIHF